MRIAIIGAGIAGITLYSKLSKAHQVMVYEKSRGVGGRIASRRSKEMSCDHGAQYFTVQHPEFSTFCQPFIDSNRIKVWQARYCNITQGNQPVFKQDDKTRLVGAPYMNSFLESIVPGKDISLNTRVESLTKHEKWDVIANTNTNTTQDRSHDWIICTTPPAQAANLLPDSFKHYEILKSVRMQPCIAVMAKYSHPIDINFEAANVTHRNISWICRDSSKPLRNNLDTMIIHSTPEFAAHNLNTQPDTIIKQIIHDLDAVLNTQLPKPLYATCHVWRYAQCAKQIVPFNLIDHNLRLAACGDWHGGGRVEGAFMSAYKLADEILEINS